MAFGVFKKKKSRKDDDEFGAFHSDRPVPLGVMLEETVKRFKRKEALIFEGKTYTYQDLDQQASRVANGLKALGIRQGDRVAIMLPNIPEFAFSFFGIQKLGAVAVPFNTLYKGREIVHILNDSGARAVITLTNSANLFNEIKSDCPNFEHLILTGQRTLVFFEPDGTANVQIVCGQDAFDGPDDAFRKLGDVFVDTLKELGVEGAWYKHQGAVRVGGKKIANIVINEIENLYVVNSVCFLETLNTDQFFKVVYVTPELKDKAVEPMTSVHVQTGEKPGIEVFRDVFSKHLAARAGIEIVPGSMGRDEKFGYEKNRAVAYKS